MTYSLSPDVPGLSFDGTILQLTGTPSVAGSYAMTYTVTDSDGDADTRTFSITVGPSDRHRRRRLLRGPDDGKWRQLYLPRY